MPNCSRYAFFFRVRANNSFGDMCHLVCLGNTQGIRETHICGTRMLCVCFFTISIQSIMFLVSSFHFHSVHAEYVNGLYALATLTTELTPYCIALYIHWEESLLLWCLQTL